MEVQTMMILKDILKLCGIDYVVHLFDCKNPTQDEIVNAYDVINNYVIEIKAIDNILHIYISK